MRECTVCTVYTKNVLIFMFPIRQKTTITKLQQDVHELEAKLHLTMVAQVRDHKGGSVLEARLQVKYMFMYSH